MHDYCPVCGEAEPLFWKGEDDEPDMQECPECGWAEELDRVFGSSTLDS